MSAATPGTALPWTCKNGVGVIFGEGCQVARCGDFLDDALVPFNAERWRQDTAYIVTVANAYPDLLALVKKLAGALEVREGDLHMLTRAIEAGDPKAELLIRTNDALRETRAALTEYRAIKGDGQ